MVQCTQYTLSICTLYTCTFSAYMIKIIMTLVCTISIGKVFNSISNFISVLMYNSILDLMCNKVLMYNNVLMCNNVLMYGSVITNPGQNATGQNVTNQTQKNVIKQKLDKMPQNKNASKL